MDNDIKVEADVAGQVEDELDNVRGDGQGDSAGSTPNHVKHLRSPSRTPSDHKAGSDTVSTPDIVHRPKSTRQKSTRAPPRPAPLFDHLPDATKDACEHFQVIADCLYGSKSLGATEHDPLDCDCASEFRKS